MWDFDHRDRLLVDMLRMLWETSVEPCSNGLADTSSEHRHYLKTVSDRGLKIG
jgi:hypothetical protein